MWQKTTWAKNVIDDFFLNTYPSLSTLIKILSLTVIRSLCCPPATHTFHLWCVCWFMCVYVWSVVHFL